MANHLTVEDIKAGVSLRALFERDGHELKKVSRQDFKCRCPFHQERSASCVVHEDRQFFKCFGCGAGGTIFEYWGLSRGLDVKSKEGFAEVCRQLSELILGHQVSAPLPRPPGEPTKPEAERPEPLSGKDLEKWQEGCRFLALHRSEQEKIATWRGYRVETVLALAEAGKMGLPRYFGRRLPAFAVETVNEQGEPYLAGFHVRVEKDGDVIWHFVPKGIGAWPFVIGDPRDCRALVILEGQWDAVAFLDALDQGVPPRNRVAIMGVRGNYSWEKALVWSWPEDQAQVWLYADNDVAGMGWLNPMPRKHQTDEERPTFAAHLRQRCKTLHAHMLEGVKDFNDAHRAAVAENRAAWTEELRATMRRQWAAGANKRRYRPKGKPRT